MTKKRDDLDDLLIGIRDSLQDKPRRNIKREEAEEKRAGRFLAIMAGVLVLLVGVVIGGVL